MTVTDLEAEAAGLILAQFDERLALRLGLIVVDIARAAALPIIINIRTANRTLFHAALPGSAANNDAWARRKSNTALMFAEASMITGTRHRDTGVSLAKHGLPAADYADHGGAVPITVKGVGMVAVATVSGLPQREDHALMVRGIQTLIAQL